MADKQIKYIGENHLIKGYRMKLKYIFMWLVIIFLSLSGVTEAANANKYHTQLDWTDKVRIETRAVNRISAELAFQLFKSGKVFLISVDTPNYYKSMTAFMGSVNIPAAKILNSKSKIKLPKNRLILMY